MFDKTDEINEIVAEVLNGKSNTQDFQVYNQPMEQELLLQLNQAKDKHPMFRLSLIGMIENRMVSNAVAENLKEAVTLLRKHNIPFDSIIQLEEE